MSIVIAWFLIGFITYLGILFEAWNQADREYQDLWVVPLAAFVLTMVGPYTYYYWWINWKEKCLTTANT